MTSRTVIPPVAKAPGAVKSNSVSFQFNALNTDLERFRQSKREAEDQFKKTQEHVGSLKQSQVGFLTKIRSAQEALGDLTRKSDMLQTEQTRLTRVLDSERKALEACVNHTETLTNKSDEDTQKYADEMQGISDEVATSLQQFQDLQFSSSLFVESMERVVVPKLPDNEQIKSSLAESIKTFTECEELLRTELSRQRAYSEKLQEAKIDITQPGIQMDLSDGPVSVTKHLDVFYGSDEEMHCF